MKNIKISTIKSHLKKLLIDASFILPDDILNAIKSAKKSETGKTAKLILDMIIKNSKIAASERLPLCQDCGNVYINIGIGKDICIVEVEDKDKSNNTSWLHDVLNEAVLEVYRDNYLRKSIVSDPLYERINTGTNLPAIIKTEFSDETGLELEVNLKGGGSENCSWLFMLKPSSVEETVINKVVELVKENGSKACPPLVVGIGLGGSASEVVNLAKKAVFRNLETRNPDKIYKSLEEKILRAVNETGIGPQGLGGKTTALACNIEYAPCHIATLPMSVFFGCHSTRRALCKIG